MAYIDGRCREFDPLVERPLLMFGDEPIMHSIHSGDWANVGGRVRALPSEQCLRSGLPPQSIRDIVSRASSRPRTNEFVAQSYCSSENSEEGRAACNGQAISQIELLALLPRELPRQ